MPRHNDIMLPFILDYFCSFVEVMIQGLKEIFRIFGNVGAIFHAFSCRDDVIRGDLVSYLDGDDTVYHVRELVIFRRQSDIGASVYLNG